ncbi:DUF1295 domain-containing protein [Nocardia sp. ET3-3]|uniref:DUF1295 domain-containing protein n=1 Tax=Nocardia terrae TaxID=2675851 RepID=A0A7K1UTQ9_9NOCA|nr:DUF1295 domain-containing protein [Nocardia terrae]MVU77549.1 DUF1295 domain-containing protein [Nocardia terrae]
MNWAVETTIWLCTALALLVLQALTFAVARRLGRYNVVDVIWGAGFALVALIAAGLGDGSLNRRILLLVLVTLWGLRLSYYMLRRTAGHGEDPRYADLLSRHGDSPVSAFTRIFLTQAVAQWVISLPLQVSAAAGPTRGPGRAAVVAGVLLWGVGVFFEALGDRQLARFKSDPANRGRIMDRGLWSWTRHPNYFGDFCVWWGLWLVAAAAWPGVLTVFAPVIMSYLLIRGTGARLLEHTMADRPGYREYQRRTAPFFPRPPRRAGHDH